MVIQSHQSFQDSIRTSKFNLTRFKFGHDRLILCTVTKFHLTTLVQSHANSIWPLSFNGTNLFDIQFNSACLISHEFNQFVVIKSYLSFQDLSRTSQFNLMWIQFSHDRLILSIVSKFHSTMMVLSIADSIRPRSFNPIYHFEIPFDHVC